MILEEETYEKFGYYSQDLTPKSNKRIIVACDECGKVRVSHKRSYRSLCRSCVNKGTRNPRFRGKSKRICGVCGTVFDVDPSAINRGRGKFCSHSCARKGQKPFSQHHTKPELIFEEICKKYNLPFKYTGDGSFWIGEKGEKQLNPDFIETNGKKVCIEIMGIYWHTRLLNQNLREDALQTYREKHYRKYKWMPVFIWDTDLIRKDAEQFVLNEMQKQGVL